jgi:hypothetical protein
LFLTLTLCAALTGCGAGLKAALETTATAWRGEPAAQTARDPRLTYLRVAVGRQRGWMVRADAPPGSPSGLTHWYSADGALLRLTPGGLLAGFAETQRDWRLTRGPFHLDWQAAAAGQQVLVERISQRQPGYHLGVRESARLLPTELAPNLPLAAELAPSADRALRWFVEQPLDGSPARAWYAVDVSGKPARLVFGAYCPLPDWCIQWLMPDERGKA